jgi:hypothetical protein
MLKSAYIKPMPAANGPPDDSPREKNEAVSRDAYDRYNVSEDAVSEDKPLAGIVSGEAGPGTSAAVADAVSEDLSAASGDAAARNKAASADAEKPAAVSGERVPASGDKKGE